MSQFHRNSAIAIVLAIIVSFAAPSRLSAESVRNLGPHYRHWIEEEVPYIISSDERKQFLSLTSDAERDHFIEAFWDIRNPDPTSATNSYKDEHYRRLTYANANYGNPSAQNGWKTDMGRIYITLGPPKQKTAYLGKPNIRPLQFWFYQATNPALPAYFYIVFYERSAGEEWSLYSPYMDGPTRLTPSGRTVNDNKAAIKTLRDVIGDEWARATLTLIPNEPVDFNDFTPSLESDTLLGTIRSLPDQELTKEMLSLRRSHEHVTSRVFLNQEQADLQTVVWREGLDAMTVHYLLRYRQPDDTLIGMLPDKHPGYSFSLQTIVLTADGKQVYEEEQSLRAEVNDAQASLGRHKCFGAEGRLPLAPGEYQIITTLTNELNRAAVREKRTVKVPDPAAQGFGISDMLAFAPRPPIRMPDARTPFSAAGLRFVPRGAQTVTLHPGEPLRLLFQIWDKASDPLQRQDQKIHVHYLYGRVQAGASQPTEENEDVDGAGFDPSGNLLTGHTLATNALGPGTYRLVVTATDPASGRKAYSSLVLIVVGENEVTDLWTAYDASAANSRTEAMDDYKRGLSARSQGNADQARTWFQRSLTADPNYEPAFSRLVHAFADAGQYSQIADLSRTRTVTSTLDSDSVLLVAEANVKTGDPKRAIQWLEADLQTHEPSASLYLALADAYQKSGNNSRAEDYKRLAAKLQPATPGQP